MQDFFYMGGYALYVWTSYALTLVLVVVNILLPLRRERRLLRDIARRERRRNQ